MVLKINLTITIRERSLYSMLFYCFEYKTYKLLLENVLYIILWLQIKITIRELSIYIMLCFFNINLKVTIRECSVYVILWLSHKTSLEHYFMVIKL